jgi:multidrug efflux pump
VRSSYEVTKPELRVQIDRDRASALGVSVQNISRTLQVLFGGTRPEPDQGGRQGV